jgi:ribosomal protein L35
MPKLKTYKALRKRIKITGKKKIMFKISGRDHFNARESSKTTMSKRSNQILSKTNNKAVNKLIPKL